MMRYFIIY